MLRTIFMSFVLPGNMYRSDRQQIIIRYKDKLDTEVLCSLRMRIATSSWALALESADSVHTGCSEIRRVEDGDLFLLLHVPILQKNKETEITTLSESMRIVSVIWHSNSVERFSRNLVWISQHHRWQEIHTLFLDVCNTNMDVRICDAGGTIQQILYPDM